MMDGAWGRARRPRPALPLYESDPARVSAAVTAGVGLHRPERTPGALPGTAQLDEFAVQRDAADVDDAPVFEVAPWTARHSRP